jgi:hypothetical protein
MPVAAAIVSPSCRPPPTKIARLMRQTRSRLNSIPSVKSRSTMPKSATSSMNAASSTRPSAFGPMATPARRKPTMGRMRSRWQT